MQRQCDNQATVSNPTVSNPKVASLAWAHAGRPYSSGDVGVAERAYAIGVEGSGECSRNDWFSMTFYPQSCVESVEPSWAATGPRTEESGAERHV